MVSMTKYKFQDYSAYLCRRQRVIIFHYLPTGEYGVVKPRPVSKKGMDTMEWIRDNYDRRTFVPITEGQFQLYLRGEA